MKNILYLIMPLSIVFLTLFFIFIKCKTKKIKYFVSFVLLFLYFFSTEIGTKIIAYENYKDVHDENLECDVIVILGGNIIERIFVGTMLQKKFNSEIIVSGGVFLDNNLTEAETYKDYLLSLGVDTKSIILENNATNTFENAKYTSIIIKEKKYENICLVTSLSHISRSVWSFEQFDTKVEPVFIDNKRDMSFKSFIPNAKLLFTNTMYLNEYMGLLYYKIKYVER